MRTIVLAAILGACLLWAGCIVTANLIIIEEVADFDVNTTTTVSSDYTDLTDNPDWEDHRDNLKGIDDIGFACRITNRLSSAATGELYITSNLKALSDTAEVRKRAVLVLSGIVVGGNSTRAIEWKDSYDFLSNFEKLKEIVLGEKFYVYFITKEAGTSVHVSNVLVFLSVNAEP